MVLMVYSLDVWSFAYCKWVNSSKSGIEWTHLNVANDVASATSQDVNHCSPPSSLLDEYMNNYYD